MRFNASSIFAEAEEVLSDRTDEVFFQVKRDCRSVLGGGERKAEAEATNPKH